MICLRIGAFSAVFNVGGTRILIASLVKGLRTFPADRSGIPSMPIKHA